MVEFQGIFLWELPLFGWLYFRFTPPNLNRKPLVATTSRCFDRHIIILPCDGLIAELTNNPEANAGLVKSIHHVLGNHATSKDPCSSRGQQSPKPRLFETWGALKAVRAGEQECLFGFGVNCVHAEVVKHASCQSGHETGCQIMTTQESNPRQASRA